MTTPMTPYPAPVPQCPKEYTSHRPQRFQEFISTHLRWPTIESSVLRQRGRCPNFPRPQYAPCTSAMKLFCLRCRALPRETAGHASINTTSSFSTPPAIAYQSLNGRVCASHYILYPLRAPAIGNLQRTTLSGQLRRCDADFLDGSRASRGPSLTLLIQLFRHLF